MPEPVPPSPARAVRVASISRIVRVGTSAGGWAAAWRVRHPTPMRHWSGTPVRNPTAMTMTIPPRASYYDWLVRDADSVEIWLTHYQHPMESTEAITDWFRSTGLKPFVDPLPDDLKEAFLERYTAAMEIGYPKRADGGRLLGFPRLFFVARKAG